MNRQTSQLISEYIVFGLDVFKRRWYVLLLPVLVVLPLAYAAAKITPAKYTAKSLILLQSEGGEVAPQNRQQLMEQVAAIEAWLKSNHIMLGLLPQLVDLKNPGDPKEINIALNVVRASISFALLGGSAVEVSLQGSKPDNLGSKLEIILGRIMEGLTGPGQGIFTAPQFILLKRSEMLKKLKAGLYNEINLAGLSSPEIVEKRLQTLYQINQTLNQGTARGPDIGGDAPSGNHEKQLLDRKSSIEQLLTQDKDAVNRLYSSYAAYRRSLADYEDLRAQLLPQSKNYFGVFNSAGIVVVGRPQDPVFGDSSGRKIAIAIMFLGIVGAGGLILLLELFYPGIHMRKEFEDFTGLPVVARFHKLGRVR